MSAYAPASPSADHHADGSAPRTNLSICGDQSFDCIWLTAVMPPPGVGFDSSTSTSALCDWLISVEKSCEPISNVSRSTIS
jgi:hypothetical protein